MSLVRSRSLHPWIGVALFLFLGSGRAEAAGCHTDCSLKSLFSDCATCGFRAVSDVICVRRDCDTCDTFSCLAALPSEADQWASSDTSLNACSAATSATAVSVVRIVKVQRMAARG